MARCRSAGLTLVELMISMLLASLLMAALLKVMMSQRQLVGQVFAMTSLAERIGFVSNYLNMNLQEAGYAPINQVAPFPVGLSGKLSGKLNGVDQAVSDELVIFSQGGRGCADASLSNGNAVSWRRFSVNRSDDRWELRCEDSEGGPYPIMDNVEAMQVQYGVDTNRDRVPDFYTNLTQLPANPSLVSLRLGLLLRSESPLSATQSATLKDHRLLDVELPDAANKGIDFNDGRIRQRVLITVTLRNIAA